jgi:hypothetical protein
MSIGRGLSRKKGDEQNEGITNWLEMSAYLDIFSYS